MNDTWLKLHTSLLASRRFVMLPSNDHRLAFICCLILQKKGLIFAPPEYVSAHVFLSKNRWKKVQKKLIESGLLNADGSVHRFEQYQVSPDAARKRRQRTGVTSHGTSHGKCPGHVTTEAEAEAEAEREKERPLSQIEASERQRAYAETLLIENGSSLEDWRTENPSDAPDSPLSVAEVSAIVRSCKGENGAGGGSGAALVTREMYANLEFEFADGGRPAAEAYIAQHDSEEIAAALHRRMNSLVEARLSE